jgi:hypothetical protein
MDRDEYELFEYLPTGALNWRGQVHDLQSARVAVWLLADEAEHECFAMDSRAGRVTLARAPQPGGKRIFKVSYGNSLASRAHALRREGYDVTSVLGNQIAKFVLAMHPPYDLFVIGDAAAEHERLEMVRWLRSVYPDSRVVALSPEGGMDQLRLRSQVSDDLLYSTPSEPVAAWLPLVSAVVNESVHSRSSAADRGQLRRPH